MLMRERHVVIPADRVIGDGCMVHVQRLKDPLGHQLFVGLSGSGVHHLADKAVSHVLITVYGAHLVDQVYIAKLQEHAVKIFAFFDQVGIGMIVEAYGV
jgi:hypothetical protein